MARDIRITPYIEIDGIRLFSDSQITGLIDRAERDGTRDLIFYGDSRYTKFDFLEKVKFQGDCALYVAMLGGDVAGFVLLDHIRYRHAHGHFCVFSEYWGTEVLTEISHAMLRLLLQSYSVLIGIVPEDNIHALRFTEKTLGMKKLTVIPRYFYNDKIKSDVDGVMFCIEKEG
jgi:RimJ/RimL family protein N-acetyltransferase